MAQPRKGKRPQVLAPIPVSQSPLFTCALPQGTVESSCFPFLRSMVTYRNGGGGGNGGGVDSGHAMHRGFGG